MSKSEENITPQRENASSNISKDLRVMLNFAWPQVFAVAWGMPFENAKLRIQTGEATGYFSAMKKIYTQEGFTSLFKGTSFLGLKKGMQAAITGVSITEMADYMRPVFTKEALKKNPELPYMLVAPLATLVSTFIAQVCDRPRVLGATTKGKGPIIAVRDFLQEKHGSNGAKGVIEELFKGASLGYIYRLTTLMGFHTLYPKYQELFKELAEKSELSDKEKSVLGGITGVSMGGITGMATRLQTEMMRSGSESSTIASAIRNVVRTRGVSALFSGYLVHLLHSGLAGLSYSIGLEKSRFGNTAYSQDDGLAIPGTQSFINSDNNQTNEVVGGNVGYKHTKTFAKHLLDSSEFGVSPIERGV